MLRITVPRTEHFNEENQEFLLEGDDLELEHSLVSMSKWESIFQKPFLAEGEKTTEEILTYIECMVLTPDFPPEVFSRLSDENLNEINGYINNKMTATWFSDANSPPSSREVITSELIYYWMFAQGIDKECENWHINRLITLLKIFNLKNAKPQKMSSADLAQRRERNRQRKAQMGTSG